MSSLPEVGIDLEQIRHRKSLAGPSTERELSMSVELGVISKLCVVGLAVEDVISGFVVLVRGFCSASAINRRISSSGTLSLTKSSRSGLANCSRVFSDEIVSRTGAECADLKLTRMVMVETITINKLCWQINMISRFDFQKESTKFV